MDRKDDFRSRNQRMRSGKPQNSNTGHPEFQPANLHPDRSRSPATGDRSSNSDRRRDRSPPRPTHRQQSRPTGPPSTMPRARDGVAGVQAQRNGSRRPNLPNQPKGNLSQSQPTQKAQTPGITMTLLAGEDEDAQMSRIMGFGDFRSTKNTKVPGNDKNHGVSKVKKTEYRQYMNRVGGFNRPLDAA